MIGRKSVVLLSACSGFMGLGGAAIAQESVRSSTLEEVVVTAQKRTQDLQDVSVAVSAFTSDLREKVGIVSVQDISNFTPGMQYSSSADRVSVRGIGRLTNNVASEGGVAIYYDGFYTASTVEAAQSPLLIERVEVLRGPQGTLYGRNSIGGAINVVSKRPSDEFDGEVRASYGSYDRRTIQGALSGPVTDNLRYRVAAVKTDQTEGYFTNVSGGPDEGGVTDAIYAEVQLEANIGETFEAWLKYGYAESDNRGRTAAAFGPYETVRVPATYTVPSPFWGFVQPSFTQAGNVTYNPADLDPWKFNTNTPQEQKLRDSHNVTFEAVWHAPGMDVKYIGGKRGYLYDTQSDYDNSPMESYPYPGVPGFTIYPTYVTYTYLDTDWTSHELNITSTHDGPLQWIVGAYVYDEDSAQALHIPAPFQPEFDILATDNGAFGAISASPWPDNSARRDIYVTQDTIGVKSRAAFAQLDYAITDAWRATIGLRYTKDTKDAEERTRQACFAYAAWCPVDPPASIGFRVPIDWTRSILGLRPGVLTGPNNGGVFEDGVVNNAYQDMSDGYWVRNLHKSWDAWTGTAGVEWKPNADTLTYLRYSRGYKAGGFNTGAIQEFPTTQPETVNAYELGWKQSIGSTLLLNAAVFYYDYTDLQAPVFIANPSGGPGQTVFANLEEVRSTGLELEATWRPFDNFTVRMAYAYLNPEIQKACCLVDNADQLAQSPEANRDPPGRAIEVAGQVTGFGQSLAGDRVPQSPEHKVNVNGTYAWQFTPGELLLSATYSWRDKTYTALFNRSYYLAPAYDQLDLRATWTAANNRYSIVAFVRNALDEMGYDGSTSTRQSLEFTQNFIDPSATIGNLVTTRFLNPPRTYGLELQYRFGGR
jgi:iron complex outermembrane receptor protein